MIAQKAKQGLKKLTSFVGIVGAIALISFPVIAQYSPPITIFQPSANGRRPESQNPSNIAEALAEYKEFQTLVDAMQQAGLTDTLQQNGPLTILAPTNEAFESLPANTLRQLLQPQNREKLASILKYHLVAGVIPKEIVERGEGQIATVEGSPVQISVNQKTGEVKLNQAQAMAPSISASNGVIVRVNKVLLPPSIAAQLTLRGVESGSQSSLRGRGFFCDSSTVETKLKKANGQQQVWIRWRSRDFDSAGYDPQKRCQEVSSRLEAYRQNKQLNFITVGQMNGQNVICTGTQAGVCSNLIYTLRPDEKDPVGALQALLAWRTQSDAARTRLESKDDSPPLIDVRSIVAEEGESKPATAPNNLTPQPQKPGKGGLPEL